MFSKQLKNKLNGKTALIYGCSVFLPFLIIVLYLAIFANDRYVSSSILMVKQVADAPAVDSTGIAALFGTMNTSGEDANVLKEYIHSRDMVEKLNQELNLRQAFLNTKDPVFALAEDAAVEDLVEYFGRVVQVQLNEKTMMLEVSSQGFSPEFSLKLNKAILKNSENFINEISQSIAQEQQKFAEKQLGDATLQLKKAREVLLDYQNKNEIYDPEVQAKAVATIIASLQGNLAQLKTEERTLLGYLNDTAPQVVAIRSQIASVETQIENENSKLTSPSNKKLNKNVADFEELKAQVSFATDVYKISITSLEKARLEASRKLKKLVVISSPRLAETALYPRKIYISISSFILLNILFGIGLLVHSVIREHKE
jgi:capsular polysaccharide transport system permease protein